MMNLKYYLRGLGIGILVTALIMGITAGGKETLSNAEIKERAKALGMVEEGTLLENAQAGLPTPAEPGDGQEEAKQPEQTEKPEETPQPEETKEQEESLLPEQTPEPTAVKEPEQTPEPAATKEPEKTPQPEEGEAPNRTERNESVTILVNRGDGSYTVCKRLEEAGLIISASEYDTFLYQNGYDKKIRSGSFEIPSDATPEQIARILSGM